MIEKNTLPQGWTIAKLGEVGVCVTGNTPPKSNSQYYGNEIPFVKPPQINNGMISDASEFLSLEGGKKARVLPINSILITCIGNLGRVGINKFPIAFNQQINAVIPSDVYLPKLLFYQAQSLEFKTQLDSFSAATTVAIVNKGNFEKIKIPLPPLNEQKRILAKLEQLLTDLDKGIEYLETTKQQLMVYRQAVLKWAFEGKLTNRDVKDGELPIGWDSKKISQVANTFGGYAFKSGEFESQGKFQVIRMGNVRPGILRLDESPVFMSKLDEKALSKAILKVNDIIVTQTGTKGKRDYGFTALISKENLLLNQRIAAIRCNEDCVSKFLLYYTWTNKFKDQFFANETGNVGQGNVGMKAVTDTIIWIPKPAEQIKVVSEIESRLSVCDKIEETIESSLQQAEALRLSIIKKAFEGKLVPQDPNDEPAEKLLERIRATKGNGKPEKKEKVKVRTIAGKLNKANAI